MLQKPSYQVTIGSTAFDHSKNPDIISIMVDLDLNMPLDRFKILLKPSAKVNDIKKGDSVIVQLGYEGALTKVMTGLIDTVEPHISEVLITGYSLMYHLSRYRHNKVYEKQSAGAVVKDIAKIAGVAVEKAEDGINFPMYSIDDTKTPYTHLYELAKKCGFDLYINPEGKLVFQEYGRKPPRPFKYGRDIISYEMDEPIPISASVKVFGESPSSFKGADTSHWRAKKVVEGTAGQGDIPFVIEDPAVRDKDSADKVAKAYLERIQVPLTGKIRTLGNARVGLGDTIEIKEMPKTIMNGEFEATSVTHHFNKQDGFISIIGWVKKVKISSAAPPLPVFPAAAGLPKAPSLLEEQLAKAQDAMEEVRLRLLDAIEAGETELERALTEINSMVANIDKVAKEMLAAAEEVRKKAMEAAKEALDKANELKKEIDGKKKDLENIIKEAEDKFAEYKKEAGKELDEHMKEITTLKEQINKLKEEGQKKISELRTKAEGEIASLKEKIPDENELKTKSEEIEKKAEDEVRKGEKEIEDLKAEGEKKIKDIEGKADEVKKKLEDAEKKVKEQADEVKKKFEETVQSAEKQVEEMKKTAENITKEADQKYLEVKKKAEEARKQAIQKFETMKKTYAAARDKVMEARKQIGLD